MLFCAVPCCFVRCHLLCGATLMFFAVTCIMKCRVVFVQCHVVLCGVILYCAVPRYCFVLCHAVFRGGPCSSVQCHVVLCGAMLLFCVVPYFVLCGAMLLFRAVLCCMFFIVNLFWTLLYVLLT
jgi:hypothetical protein